MSMAAVGVITLGSRILVLIMSAALGVITARFLGPEQRGIYVLPSVAAGPVLAGLSGLGMATSFYLLNRGVQTNLFRPIFLSALLFISLGSLLVALLTSAAHQLSALVPAILALIPGTILYVASGYLLGNSRVLANTALTTSWTLSTFLTMTLGLLILPRTASNAIVLWLLSMLPTTIVGIAIFLRNNARQSERALSFRSFSGYAGKVGLTNLVSLLNYRIDVYLVAVFTDPASLAIYTVAVTGAEAVGVFTQVLPQISLPAIGRMDIEESAAYTARCARVNLFLAAIVCVGIYVVSPWAVVFLYGNAFAGAVTPLRILLVGSFAMAPASLITTYFSIRLGWIRFPLAVVSTSAVLGAVISVILIPRIGIAGGAVATSASYVVTIIAAVVYFLRFSRIPVKNLVLVQREDIATTLSLLRALRARFAG